MTNRTVVPDIPKLRSMAKAGLIELHADTGKKVRHWTGKQVKAYYVEGLCSGVERLFEFKGRQYKLKYFDGCFHPFVVDIGFAEEIGVNLNATLIV